MEKKITGSFVVIATILLATDSLAQQPPLPPNSNRVDTEPNIAIVSEGQSQSFLCRYGVPALYCRITIPNTKVLILSDAWQTEGFKYFGTGLSNGQCGVTIDHIQASHNGQIRCDIGTVGGEVTGFINVTVAARPIRPEIEVADQAREYEINSEFRATCVSRDGRPPANLTWFLDDIPVTEGIDYPETIVNPIESNNSTLFTSRLSISRFLRAEDDRKDLVCRAYHLAYGPQMFEETKMALRVRYGPLGLPPQKLYGFVLGQTAHITVTIRSNPGPRVVWTVNGESVAQGTRNGRYEAYEPVALEGGNTYNVTLTIASLTLEDTTTTYQLRADNQFGSTDYTVRISSSEAAPMDMGLDVGALIAVAATCTFFIIIIVLVVFAWRTGRWCFGGSHRTDIGGIGDSEAQVTPFEENEKNHEEFLQSENGGQPNSTEIHDELRPEAIHNGNGNKTDVKNNTPV